MVTLDDGTEEEVYTKEEVEGYQKGSDKNKERKEELLQLKEKLGVSEDGTFDDTINELKENANPNFTKFRAKHKAMEKALKDDGKEFDENGNPVTGNEQMTSEEIQELIDKGVDKKLNTSARETALSEFDGEDRKKVEHFLDKLMPLGGSLNENMDIAITKAFPESNVSDIKKAMSSGGGRPAPYTGGKQKSFTETEAGMKMMQDGAPAGYEVKLVDGKHKLVKKA